MDDFPVVSGVGPAKSYKTYAVPGATPTFHIAYDNYGVNCGTNVWGTAKPYTKDDVPGYYYSWIFIAPDSGTGYCSVTINRETGWAGDDPVCQLYGGWSHNIDSNPTTDPNNWVAIGGPVTLSGAGLNGLASSVPNIYPAYVVEVLTATGTGVVDWSCEGA